MDEHITWHSEAMLVLMQERLTMSPTKQHSEKMVSSGNGESDSNVTNCQFSDNTRCCSRR